MKFKTYCLRKEESGWCQVLVGPWNVGLRVDLHHFILNQVLYELYSSCSLPSLKSSSTTEVSKTVELRNMCIYVVKGVPAQGRRAGTR